MKNSKNTALAKLPAEALTETGAIVRDLDRLINDRRSDLEELRALTRAILDNASPTHIIKQHVAGLAQSARDSYICLRKTRDKLMELHGEPDDRSLSRTDLLTGLPNTTALMNILADCHEFGNQALLIVEMAGIRVIADELGVKVARRVIGRAAAILRRSVKERDVVARIGPHSFAVLLQDVGRGKGTAVAFRIFDALAQRLSPSGANIVEGLVLSIGLTLRLSATEETQVFFERAQSAVNKARTLNSPRLCVV